MSQNAFGVELLTASGRVFYSTELTTWNYIQQFQVKAGESAASTFPTLKNNKEFKERLVQRSFVNPPPLNGEPILPSYYWLEDTLYIGGDGNVDTLITVLAR